MLPISVIAVHQRHDLRATRIRVLPVLTIALLLAGCAGSGETKSGAIKLGPGDVVSIVEQDHGAAPNSHPVRLQASEISAALASIRFEREATGQALPGGRQLFTDGDLKSASVALQEAFLRAGPRDDVALRLVQLRSADLVTVLRQSHITAARLFYADNRLHVILGTIDHRPGHTFATAGTPTPKINYSVTDSARTFVDEIGSRNKMMAAGWSPSLPTGIQFHRRDRQDWLEIDMNVFHAAASPASASPVGRDPAQPSRAPRQMSNTLEDRLTKLRDLHEQGLISDELYDQKMRELVDSHLGQ